VLAGISRTCSRVGFVVRRFSIFYMFDNAPGVLSSQDYVSLNLWNEDQKHLLGMFCNKYVK